MTSGSSRRRAARRARLELPLALLAAGSPAAVVARAGPPQTVAFSIPPTSLDAALTQIGRAAQIDVVSTEPGLARVRSRAVNGQLTPRAALEVLLRDTGYRLVAIDARSFRVVRAAAPHSAPPRAAPRPRDVPREGSGDGEDVIVIASKQRVSLQRYAGSVTVIGGAPASAASATGDLTGAARVTPVLENTEFGPGRNKIFIRGIADSSFNGAAQSTASVYLADVQVSYSGADPSIRLYDMQDVEVLEGPQGTLYGSGSIGGIVRLSPAPPVLDAIGGSVTTGVTLTHDAEAGGDVAAVLNLPVARDVAGVRAVAYRVRDGGYIDDLGTGRADANRIDTVGGRLAGRIEPGAGWRIDLTGLYQRIDADDAQYADRDIGRLARRSAVAQPYDNEVALGSAVAAKQWDSGLQLLSVVGVASTHGHNVFDATPPTAAARMAPATIYATSDAKLLLTQETRLSRALANGNSWLVGFTLLRNSDAENRTLGPAAAPTDIIGVTNVTKSASVFAEGTARLFPAFSLTLGARLTVARTDGEPSFRPRVSDYVEGRSTRRIDPTVAFSWQLAPRLSAFGRAQTGYRTGGLAVARGIGRVADFQSDSIRVGEVGLRRLRTGETGLSVTTAVSYARWKAIQADLVNRRGLPYTDNIGNARVQAWEGMIDWIPVRGLRGIVSFLQTHNTTSGALSNSSSPAHRRLPDTPPFAITGDLSYRWTVGRRGDTLLIGGTAHRVGRSVLGTGDLFDLDQGRYSTLGVRGGWQRGRYDLSLTAENITNARGNLFASGNPFELTTRSILTPLRPFNVRLGAKVNW